MACARGDALLARQDYVLNQKLVSGHGFESDQTHILLVFDVSDLGHIQLIIH